MAAPSPANHPGIRQRHGVIRRKGGKWGAKIRHPVTAFLLLLGPYDTPEEAEEAYANKKLEFDSLKPRKGSGNRKRHEFASVDCVKMKHKQSIDVAEEDMQAYNGGYASNGGSAQGSQYERYSTDKTTFVRGLGKVMMDEDLRKPFSQNDEIVSVRRSDAETVVGKQTVRHPWGCNVGNMQMGNDSPLGTYDTAEVDTKKQHEFVPIGFDEKKHSQSNIVGVEETVTHDGIQHNVADHCSTFACESQAAVSEAGSSRMTVDVCRESYMDVDNMGVINSFGQFIGDFSRLDDELWLE